MYTVLFAAVCMEYAPKVESCISGTSYTYKKRQSMSSYLGRRPRNKQRKGRNKTNFECHRRSRERCNITRIRIGKML
jgi:hypothetical protein